MEKNMLENLPEDLHSILLDELVQNPFMGVNITNGEGRVLFLNKTHYKITGHPPELYIGRTMKEITDDGLISESATLITLSTKQPTYMSQISSHKNRFFQVTAIPVTDSTGTIKYVINYLIEVSDLVELRNQLNDAYSHNQELMNNNELLRKKLNRSGELVYQSTVMQNVVEAAAKVAEHDVSVLITGPSGSGKEMIANLLHSHSSRSNAPFIKINCAAIPEQLLESELFGYAPGAFTNANPQGYMGKIRQANGGTLFLDEVDSMPLKMQAALLRVLEEKQVTPVGGNEAIPVDFRIVTATNQDLKVAVQKQKFRQDLFYRLYVCPLSIPPLRERKEDILPLIRQFCLQKKWRITWQQDIYQVAKYYPWHGNIREFNHFMERLYLLYSHRSPSEVEMKQLIEATLIDFQPEQEVIQKIPELTSVTSKTEHEQDLILRVLKQTNFHMSKTADILNISRTTLYRKIKKYQIDTN